ncbi:MAG: NADH-quinone oxidoreductase subunit M, partial [Pseudomonadota bacterium]|nr:NADH-quinone oxidoreductase subunit M [Pseudomonadota bacterium]
MTDWPILSTITVLPLLGAFFIFLIRGDEATAANNAKAVALWTSVVTLFLTGFMVSQFDGSSAAFQFVERINWLGDGVDYAMGVDGISILFVLLTAALMPICILASWHSITHRVREYMLAF